MTRSLGRQHFSPTENRLVGRKRRREEGVPYSYGFVRRWRVVRGERSDRLLVAAGKKDVGGCLPRVPSQPGFWQGGCSTSAVSKPGWWEERHSLLDGPRLEPPSVSHQHGSICSSTQPLPRFPRCSLRPKEKENYCAHTVSLRICFQPFPNTF